MLRRITLLFLAAWTLPAMARTDTPPMSTQVFTMMLVEYLGAEPVECSTAVTELDGGERASCARFDLEWRAIKKKTRSLFKKHLPEGTLGDGVWEHDKELRWRYVVTTEEPLRLLFDLDRQWLAVIPSHPCFEASLLESLDLHVPGRDGVTSPEPTHKVYPEYPVGARQQRAGGSVTVEVIVLKNGSVGNICVVRSSRPGVGFELAAISAASQWRYKPATKNGVPVNARSSVTSSWSLP